MKDKIIAAVAGATLLVGGTYSVGSINVGGPFLDITEATFTPLIQQEQVNYFTAKGYYFQTLPTHTNIPTMGTPEIADLLKIPTERGEVQNDAPKSLLKLSTTKDYAGDFRVTINTCERGVDRGYTVIYEQMRSGIRWVKRVSGGLCGENNDWTIEQRLSDSL